MPVKAFRGRWAALGAVALGCIALSSIAGTPARDTQVTISGFMFMPMTLVIKAGARVSWTNKDDEPHTIVSDAGLFRSAAIDTDETYTFRFMRPGTYHYTCSIHPRMLGTILVQ
jgi:plastocyanin